MQAGPSWVFYQLQAYVRVLDNVLKHTCPYPCLNLNLQGIKNL